MMINQAYANMGLETTQMVATLMDGVARHSAEGMWFKKRAEDVGFKQAINERDYGDLAGLNKDDAREKWGDEQVHIWRRSHDVPPPGGESLKDTGARVWPYYIPDILPTVLPGQTVLVAAHGNSLRSVLMVLEGHDEDSIVKREIATGVPMIFKLSADSTVASKEVLGDETKAH